jgi:hypothetical protein
LREEPRLSHTKKREVELLTDCTFDQKFKDKCEPRFYGCYHRMWVQVARRFRDGSWLLRNQGGVRRFGKAEVRYLR